MNTMEAHEALERVIQLAGGLPWEAAKEQETLRMMGEGWYDQYDRTERLILQAIRHLQEALEKVRQLRAHQHMWTTSEDGLVDFCEVCGVRSW